MGTFDSAHDVVADRYTLIQRIGRGGAGEVWRGWDQQLQRDVAVKRLVLMPDGAADDGHPSQSRALREARAAARLRHEGAVTIFDVIEEDGVTHLIMEFVDAPDLAQVIARDGTLPPSRVAGLGMDLAATLQAAHQLGVVHRDVKPSNVLMPVDGRPRLTDFGTALLVGDDRLTTTGLIIGSPAYMSPEQARGEHVDHRTDLWSLGATLYHATEGVPPFAGGTPFATAHAVANDPPRPPTAAGPLGPLLLQLLRKNPADRPDAHRVTAVLGQLASDAPPPAFGNDRVQAPETVQTTVASAPLGTAPPGPDPPGPDNVIDVRTSVGRAPVLRSNPAARQRMVAAVVALMVGAGAVFGIYRAIQPADDDQAAATPSSSVLAQEVGTDATPSVTPTPVVTPTPAVAVGPDVSAGPAPTAAVSEPPATPVLPTSAVTTVPSPVTVSEPPATPAQPISTSDPAPTPTEGAPPTTGPEFGGGAVPADWVPFDPDHAPYVVQHPADWTITRLDDTRTDIRDPSSAAYLRLDWTDNPKPDALQDWLNYEATFGPPHPGYERIRLEQTTYKGEPAAIWEYAYDTDGGRVHAYNLNVAGQEYGYALNFQTRDEDWERHRPLFDAFAGSYAITD